MNRNNLQMGQQGFTLVELSIVLVIIGLLIGGVLVGQNLITAAQIRATVSQYEKFNTAVNTFKTKYNGIPGDLLNTTANSFGLTCLGGGSPCAGGAGLGDSNGLVDTPAAAGTASTGGSAATVAGEVTLFWKHLSEANMVEGTFDGAQTGATLDGTFPRAKTGAGGWAAYAVSSRNYYQIGAATTAGAGTIAAASALSPQQAFQVDTKVDDGMPNTGIVVAKGGATLDTAATAGAANGARCIAGTGTTDTYNNVETVALCQLRLSMQ